MTFPYSQSYPPSVWETAPVVALAQPEESAAAEQTAAADPGEATVKVSAERVDQLDKLVVTAGEPGSYDPPVKASERPRNMTELRAQAGVADPAPWQPGQYVLVGESGKRAHWDGEDWASGEA